jgi:hypothetical protein
LWKIKKVVNVYFERVIIQNDQIERVNNLSIVQSGTYGKWMGHSTEFNDQTSHADTASIPESKICTGEIFLSQ